MEEEGVCVCGKLTHRWSQQTNPSFWFYYLINYSRFLSQSLLLISLLLNIWLLSDFPPLPLLPPPSLLPSTHPLSLLSSLPPFHTVFSSPQFFQLTAESQTHFSIPPFLSLTFWVYTLQGQQYVGSIVRTPVGWTGTSWLTSLFSYRWMGSNPCSQVLKS